MKCEARIRPFPAGLNIELECEVDDRGGHIRHEAHLREYGYLGSSTLISWDEGDRRNFYGDWAPCGIGDVPCVLPAGHHGKCAE